LITFLLYGWLGQSYRGGVIIFQSNIIPAIWALANHFFSIIKLTSSNGRSVCRWLGVIEKIFGTCFTSNLRMKCWTEQGLFAPGRGWKRPQLEIPSQALGKRRKVQMESRHASTYPHARNPVLFLESCKSKFVWESFISQEQVSSHPPVIIANKKKNLQVWFQKDLSKSEVHSFTSSCSYHHNEDPPLFPFLAWKQSRIAVQWITPFRWYIRRGKNYFKWVKRPQALRQWH